MVWREGALAVCQEAGTGGSVGVELWVDWRCCVGPRRKRRRGCVLWFVGVVVFSSFFIFHFLSLGVWLSFSLQ